MQKFSSFLQNQELYKDLFRILKKANGDRQIFRNAAIENGYTDSDVTAFIKNGINGAGKQTQQDQWWDNLTPERTPSTGTPPNAGRMHKQ